MNLQLPYPYRYVEGKLLECKTLLITESYFFVSSHIAIYLGTILVRGNKRTNIILTLVKNSFLTSESYIHYDSSNRERIFIPSSKIPVGGRAFGSQYSSSVIYFWRMILY